MNTLKKIKLNAISENNLENREMNALRGGEKCCSCSCAYEGAGGGSSTGANGAANHKDGKNSKTGETKLKLCSGED